MIAIAPDDAHQRHERASANRSVTLHPTCDGMAELVAYLPAIQARQAFDTLTAAAHTMDAPDEHRTLGQRRADSLVDLLCGRQNPPQVTVSLTVDSDTLLGLASHPVELAGFGTITAGAARRFLARQDPVYRRLITDSTRGSHRRRPAALPADSWARAVHPRTRSHLPVPWMPAPRDHHQKRRRS
ncbi:MAG: DUF222 domain-containing protein [Actinomycetes bacterium]